MLKICFWIIIYSSIWVKKSWYWRDMQIEPLPKVTFLPVQLTELVIKNWTGETIDFEKNGQVRTMLSRIICIWDACKLWRLYSECSVFENWWEIRILTLSPFVIDMQSLRRLRHMSVQGWTRVQGWDSPGSTLGTWNVQVDRQHGL